MLQAPLWLSLLALGLVIVALHLRRRRRVVVSSVYLWQRLEGRQGRARNRSKLRMNASLLLQLLALALVVLALARPQPANSLAVQAPDHLVVVVDNSGSMWSRDVAPSRLEAAKAWARQAVTGLPGTVRHSLVVASASPSVPAARQSDPAVVAGRLDELRPEIAAPDWQATARLVDGLIRPEETTRVLVLSDAAELPAEISDLSARAGVDASVRTFLGTPSNVGIVAARTDQGEGGLTTVEGSLLAANPRAEEVELALYYLPDADGAPLLWDTATVRVDRPGEREFGFEVELPEGGGLLELRLPADDVEWDDRVWLAPPAAEGEVRVLVVGVLDPPLQRAFQSVDGVALYQGAALPSDSATFDLVVVNGAPVTMRPGTNTWWLGTVPVAGPEAASQTPAEGTPTPPAEGPADEPGEAPVDWDSLHPLSLGVGWGALRVDDPLELTSAQDLEVLVEGRRGPLVAVRREASGLELVTAFSLQGSNWASLPAFPSFVANVVAAVRAESGSLTGGCLVGRPCALPGGNDQRVIGPQGEPVSVEARAAMPSFVPRAPGIHRLVSEASSLPLLVNAILPGESFAPSGSTPEADGVDGGEATAGDAAANAAVPASNAWRWFAAAAILVLVADILSSGLRGERFLSRRALAGPHPALARNRSLVAIQLALLALLMLAVFQVPLPTRARLQQAVLVVPDSAPASDQARRRVAELLAHADREQSPPAVVTVGAPSRIAADLGEDAPGIDGAAAGNGAAGSGGAGSPRTGGNDVASALELARGMLAGREEGRIIFAWDGIVSARSLPFEPPSGEPPSREPPSGEPPSAQAPSASRDSAHPALHVVPLPPADPGEVLVEAVRVPDSVGEGETFLVEAVIGSRDGGSVAVTLSRDGERIDEQVLDLSAGRQRIDWRQEAAEPGRYLYEVQVSATGDERSENNRASAALRVEAAPLATIITPDEAWGELFGDVLEVQGWQTEVLLPRNAPWTMDDLLEKDVVALLNVPAIDLHSIQQELLRRWVSEHGGGLAIVGGENTFGPGGYFQTSLEEISPLSSRVRQETPAVALMFVLDRSGSMIQAVGEVTRIDIAKEAAKAAIDLLNEESEAGVVAFDTVASVVAPLTRLDRKESVLGAIDSLRASGGTSIYPGLELAFDEMAASEASVRHVIVMTDGLSQPGPFEELTRRFGEEGITISGVSIGDNANRAIVEDIARWGGGTFHATRDFAALPGILAQEALLLGSSPVRSDDASPVWADRDFPFLDNLPATWPPLGGYVATTAKPEASVHLVMPAVEDREEEPLLASWRYGLGRVIAFTSHGAGNWTEEWLAGNDYPLLWGQSLRWLLPQTAGPGLHLASRLSGELAELEVEAIDENGVAVTGGRVKVSVDDGGGQPVASVELLEVAPGSYRGEVYLDEPGMYRLTAGLVDDAGEFSPAGNAGAVDWLDHPYPSRYRFTLADRYLPSDPLATGAGTTLTPADAARLFASQGVWRLRDAQVFWLLAALALFMVSLLLRYSAFSRLGRLLPSRSTARRAHGA